MAYEEAPLGEMYLIDGMIRVEGKGRFDVVQSRDDKYPGIDVEFIPDDKNYSGTCPRIVFEYPEDGKLRLLIWGDKNQEDYTEQIIFDI